MFSQQSSHTRIQLDRIGMQTCSAKAKFIIFSSHGETVGCECLVKGAAEGLTEVERRRRRREEEEEEEELPDDLP